MSIESFSPLPLNVFGTWVTLLDPSDVPAGMSPVCGRCGIFSRAECARGRGWSRNSPALAGTPQINGVKTYATTNLVQRFLALDSLGNLVQRNDARACCRVAAAGRACRARIMTSDHAVWARIYGVF